MIPVAGHTSGFFLIGETEVTRSLYYGVTSSSATTNNDYPIADVEYDNFYSFISELNYQTNLQFSLPTQSQWQYAAGGGKISQGYTYSGSNNPGDVAWYAGNSNGSTHPVKQLAPNELGIYDMSGNVAEFTSTSYGGSDYSYGSSNYTSNRYCGGCYNLDASSIKITSYEYMSNGGVSYSDVSYVGYRLILKCD